MLESKKIDRLLARFYPPGIVLGFIDSRGESETKTIDLLNLNKK